MLTSTGDAVSLSLDEFEALRLADFEGLYQEVAASLMQISRQTFGRIIESAHYKVARALIRAKALHIEDGEHRTAEPGSLLCNQCQYKQKVSSGTRRAMVCPRYKDEFLLRADSVEKPTPRLGKKPAAKTVYTQGREFSFDKGER
jgi:uncharacterized protein